MIDGGTWLNVALVVLFVLIGGVFAATELALVSLRESQIRRLDESGGRGTRVASLARDPNRFLAAVQIGVTVAGFLSAAYGGSTIAPDVAPYLVDLGLSDTAADTVALIVLTLAIAYLSLVFGELVPKRLALQRAAGLAVITAPVLDKFATAMRPVIWLLSKSTNAVVRLLGGDPSATQEEVTEEELRDIVSSHEGLGEDERQILDDVFAARTSSLKEVMQPRGEVCFVDESMPVTEAAEMVREKSWSRYPVIDGGFDHVTGLLHARDLLGVAPDDQRRVSDVRRDILMLPGTKGVLPTVAVMREQGTHMAVVVDEYGGTDGIVTLEDLIEEIVGDIRDEYDDSELDDDSLDDGTLEVPGGLSIEDFADETGIELEDGDYETVAGYVIAHLGRIPDEGDSVPLPGAVLTVTERTGLRVSRIGVQRVTEQDHDAGSPGSPGSHGSQGSPGAGSGSSEASQPASVT